MMSQIIFLPSIMLSGIMFPIDMLPKAFEIVGNIFPAAWGYKLMLNDGFRLENLWVLLVQGIRCGIGVKNGEERLATYNATTADLSYGDMTYVDTIPDKGVSEDKVILSMHGIFGGYDQAYDTVRDFASSYRILAPSRFGYLGSDE